jgi:glycosyltransferase involved in cell wall biosynthesis
MNLPEISIIIPTLDRAVLLQEALDSLRQQTFQNWEALVIDDGSQDDTESQVFQLSQLDPRIRYVKRSETPSGAPACRNLGTRLSKGNYLIYLDSDDCLSKDALAKRFSCMELSPELDFGIFPCVIFREHPDDSQLLLNVDKEVEDLDRFLSFDLPWQTMCPIWRKTALDRLGDWNESLLSWQDVEYHIRALSMGFKYKRFPYPDCFWRVCHPGSVSDTARGTAHLNSHKKLLIELQQRLDRAGLLTKQRRHRIGGLYFGFIDPLASEGFRNEALEIWSLGFEQGIFNAQVHQQGVLYILASTVWVPHRMVRRTLRRLMRKYFQLAWGTPFIPEPSKTTRSIPVVTEYPSALSFESAKTVD